MLFFHTMNGSMFSIFGLWSHHRHCHHSAGIATVPRAFCHVVMFSQFAFVVVTSEPYFIIL